MQVIGLFLVLFSIWSMYCSLHSFNPITLMVAIIGSKTGAQTIIAQAKSDAATRAVPSGDYGMTPALAHNVTSGVLTGSSTQAYQQYAFAQLAKYGQNDPADEQALVKLWNEESGWNPQALNKSSGAFGIPQALPASKIPGGMNSTAQQQIDWGLAYIEQRYGSPSKAYAFETSHSPNWY